MNKKLINKKQWGKTVKVSYGSCLPKTTKLGFLFRFPPKIEWLQASDYKRLATSGWLQASGYKRMAMGGYKRVATNGWLQTDGCK